MKNDKKLITFEELKRIFSEHEINNSDKEPLIGRVVFTEDSFDKKYTSEQRTYEFSSRNKYFMAGKNGNSIFADCLDGKDLRIRLDWYIGIDWHVEYCYIVEDRSV